MARALARLSEQGFAEAARNTRGDSVYLKTAGCDLALRVSNHARTPKQRRNHPDAVTSLVLREPKSAAQVDDLVAATLRNFFAERARRAS
ncbi:hypothetical protein ASG40_13340 [Methylobacterium sp. Leaf399]|nr:hypothetical protein ASF39_11715 [Methylobacterium sp. Leaf108]KQT07952.1 hypothetical protein ASG40_13340 [Methylobacterium sp. Leaf399]KQT89058.1 hypothetical protein ASG59_14105 [Methylobacterium sp. Leaf466]